MEKLALKLLLDSGWKHHPSREGQLKRLALHLERMTPKQRKTAHVARCADENTGYRFGRAKCREGRCWKIGHSTYEYQLWLVWE